MPEYQIALSTIPEDDATLDQLHRRLRTYLEDAGIEEIHNVRTEPLEGSRGVGDIMLGFFSIAGPAVVSGVVGALTGAILEFVKRSDHPISIRYSDREITIHKATAEQGMAALEKFFTDNNATKTGGQ